MKVRATIDIPTGIKVDSDVKIETDPGRRSGQADFEIVSVVKAFNGGIAVELALNIDIEATFGTFRSSEGMAVLTPRIIVAAFERDKPA